MNQTVTTAQLVLATIPIIVLLICIFYMLLRDLASHEEAMNMFDEVVKDVEDRIEVQEDKIEKILGMLDDQKRKEESE